MAKRKKKKCPTLSQDIARFQEEMVRAAVIRLELPPCPQIFMDEQVVRNFTRQRNWLTFYQCGKCAYFHVRNLGQR